jgi:hypothetical protein
MEWHRDHFFLWMKGYGLFSLNAMKTMAIGQKKRPWTINLPTAFFVCGLKAHNR